nr:lysine-rich arabinogalactan protein 19-like [Lolium perenne]
MEEAIGAMVLVPTAPITPTATGRKGKMKAPKKELTPKERAIQTKKCSARRQSSSPSSKKKMSSSLSCRPRSSPTSRLVRVAVPTLSPRSRLPPAPLSPPTRRRPGGERAIAPGAPPSPLPLVSPASRLSPAPRWTVPPPLSPALAPA